MKKNRLIIILVLAVLLTTGCTKQFKNADGSIIKAEKTNQVLVENILQSDTDRLTALSFYGKQNTKDYEKNVDIYKLYGNINI